MKYLKYYEIIKNNKNNNYYVQFNEEKILKKFNNIENAILYSKQQLNLNNSFLIGIYILPNIIPVNKLDSVLQDSQYLVKWYGPISHVYKSFIYNTPEIVLKYLLGVKGYYEDILKFRNSRMILNKIRIDNPKLWDLLKQYVDSNEMEDFANLNDLGI